MSKILSFFKSNVLMFSLVGIPLILFLLISFIFKSYSNIWVFPFNVEIWGTVSDWFMVWVTAITALYLIKTFKEQQRLTQFESYSFKEKIRPTFSLEANIIDFNSNVDGTATAIIGFEIIAINNDAFDVNVSLHNEVVLSGESLKFPDLPMNKVHKGFGFTFPYFELSITSESLAFNELLNGRIDYKKSYYYFNEFEIEYSDLENNRYIQSILFRIDNEKNIICQNWVNEKKQ